MLAADRDIFDLPAVTRLEDHHPARIELWIRAATLIVARSIKDAHQKVAVKTVNTVSGRFRPN
jgi:hypothetical protein